MEHTNALVPDCGGGEGTGRFNKPPGGPVVSMRQYSTGKPSTLAKFQLKISL